MPSCNKLVIAAAGTGKTTALVKYAIKHKGKPILITTYTNNGCAEIKQKFIDSEYGHVPSWVTIKSWYTFILQDCIRPYQALTYDRRVSTVFFSSNPEPFHFSRRYISESKNGIEQYYFVNKDNIIDRHAAKFAVRCNDTAGGAVIKRLQAIYKYILIDGVQDLAGWDLTLIELLLKSNIGLFLVSDPRQCTYLTNHSPKNKNKNGTDILKFFEPLKALGLIEIETMDKSHRCNQLICNFANNLYPNLPSMTSATKSFNSDGVFFIRRQDAKSYIETSRPKLLRWDIRTRLFDLPMSNFGDVKGLSFENVLICPAPLMVKYLEGGALEDKPLSIAKFYVAVTRARRQVIFIYDGNKDLIINQYICSN